MKTEYREHPLGTPGLSARRMARSLDPESRMLRFLASLFPGLRGASSSWDKGAEGEEAVARKLDKLPRDRWITLHDRKLGDGGRNVDHLVIGPGGVFSVNTKNLGGRVVVKPTAFLVNGFPERCLHVARDEAARVGERLTIVMGAAVEVEPVIVVLSPELRVDAQPDDVHVLGLKDVPRWFAARPSTLDPKTSNRIYEAARAGRTWTGDVAALRAASSV